MKRKRTDQRSGRPLSENSTRGGGGKGSRHGYSYRLKAVKLHLEEGYPVALVAGEMGCAITSVRRWVSQYRETGEEGLRADGRRGGRGNRSGRAGAVGAKIRELKREDPSRGVRRISDLLRRFFWMQAAPSTVHAELKEAELMEPPARKKPVRNPGKPRFFERSTPNQLWQSDIMSFRMGGKAVYLIGYIDDYSRYIVGLGLYRSQTGEAVLETYRRAAGDYGIPRELLTDNGRQYATWRGKTKFQRELEKDKVHHLRSQPHHPMTLGKIERFWKSILEEFLQRARFEDFEEARERIALWVKYYNYRRPHQGIGGLCPADRYFEINHDLKETLAAGIEENVLETALRGKPAAPFYMVGRMGEQSVVIRAEKGKVRLLVDGREQEASQELTYQIERTIHGSDNDYSEPNAHDNESSDEAGSAEADLQCRAEDPRGAGGVDGEPQAGADRARAGDHHGALGPVAEEGDEGDHHGDGTASGRSGQGVGPLAAHRADAPRPGAQSTRIEACPAPGGDAGWDATGADQAGIRQKETNEQIPTQGIDEAGPEAVEARVGDPQGAGRPDDRCGGGQTAGRVAENLLRVGESRPGRDDGGPLERKKWAPFEPGRRREGAPSGGGRAAAPRERAVAGASGYPENARAGGAGRAAAAAQIQGTEDQ